MIHSDIILGVNNTVQFLQMLLFQDILAEQAGFTHPWNKHMNKLPQSQQGWRFTLPHLLWGSYSVARVGQCPVLVSSCMPNLLPCLCCGYDKSIYLQFITITTMEPEHSKFRPLLWQLVSCQSAFKSTLASLFVARMVQMCQHVDENWTDLFSSPRMS